MRDHVALLLPALEGGGAERVFCTLARLLAERGLPIELVVGSARGPLRDEVADSVELVELRAERLRGALPALMAHLRRSPPACLVATLHPASVLALLAVRTARVPTPVVVRVASAMTAAAAMAVTPSGRLTLAATRGLYPRASALVAPSADLAADTDRFVGLPAGTTRVLANPVLGASVWSGARAPLDHPWFAPGQPPVVLAVGRLTPQKDIAGLLDAFARVRRRTPARLLVLGEGPERASLQARIDVLGLTGDVALPGYDPNPFRYMARAEVFVLSSRYEGLPGVLVQALGCGAKVVATDCPTGPREILGGGAHGRLVPVGDPVALASALSAALAEPRRRADPAAWQRYTEQAALDAYLALLEEVGAPVRETVPG